MLPALKYSTKLHCEHMVNKHLVPEFGDMQLRLITRELVQNFLTEKLRTGLSWKTVKSIRTTFGTILRAAEADDLLSDNPVLKTRLPRRGPIPEKASIAPAKLLELLDTLPGHRNHLRGCSLLPVFASENCLLSLTSISKSAVFRVRQTALRGSVRRSKDTEE